MKHNFTIFLLKHLNNCLSEYLRRQVWVVFLGENYNNMVYLNNLHKTQEKSIH